MKRVELIANHGEFQAGSTVELEDEVAESVIKRGRGKLSRVQTIYGHIDEMPPRIKEQALQALEIADAAGGYREQQLRAQATAPFRK